MDTVDCFFLFRNRLVNPVQQSDRLVSATRGAITIVKQKTRQVRPEDFKNQEWLAAAEHWLIEALENGKLLLITEAHSDDEVRQRVHDELMKFVKPIRQYATNEWKNDNRIDHLWNKIFESRHFYSSFLGKKGPGQGQLSLYRAIAFVKALWKKGVYIEAKGTLKKALLPSSIADNIWKNTSPYKVDKEKGEDKELDRIMSQV